MDKGHIIKKIAVGSIAEELELESGDRVMAVNNQAIEDVFDYHYLINDEYIEVIAIDKTAGKLQNLYYPYNRYINSDDPKETVLYEDSYAQLNTKLTIENFVDLKKYRKTKDLLSKTKLDELLNDYKDYQNNNRIKEERIVGII